MKYDAHEAAKEVSKLKSKYFEYLRKSKIVNESEEREILMELNALYGCIQRSKQTGIDQSERIAKITERVNNIIK